MQIKDVFGEQWDDYQLRAVSFEFGGNEPFSSWLKEYNLTAMPAHERYKKTAVQFY